MPSCFDTSFDGPAMFTAWMILVFQRDFSTVNCQQGNAQQADPKKRYKDTLKEALKLCTIPQTTWHEIAVDRTAWRSLVRSGVDDFEERWIKQKEERRQKRKECQNPAPQPDPAHSFPCAQCNRLFRARIGLISHLRTHPLHQ